MNKKKTIYTALFIGPTFIRPLCSSEDIEKVRFYLRHYFEGHPITQKVDEIDVGQDIKERGENFLRLVQCDYLT